MTHTGLSRGMQMKMLYLIIAVTTGANLIYPPANANTLYLPEFNFDEKVDGANAKYVNVDLAFSSKFHNCLNKKLETSFIDSSTVE